MILHTYGDSHASEWGAWDKLGIPGLDVRINHIQGKLMYSFGRDMMEVVSGVRDGDMVVFCFGEIDCRCHINKYEPQWEKVVDDIVDKYFRAIEKNVKNLNVTTFVYNVVPPLERELPENLHTEIGNLLPSLGSDEDRKRYTLYMNERMLQYCKWEYPYVFFDVYHEYVNERGYLNPEFSDKNCHINNPIFMREFLLNHIK